MPEDIFDKIIDFQLMLEGYTACCKDGSCPGDKESTRLMSYWYKLSSEIEQKLNDAGVKEYDS